MGLPIPVVGIAPGPEYATDVNASLTLVDQHNHSAGYGVQITPNGLNINIDLPINSNNLTLIRTLRFFPQITTPSNPTDLGVLYETGVDLYFIDGAGNNVRITQSGGIAGSPGSISNLVSPASASYVLATSTFVWESDVNTPANLDAASILLRNLVANSNALTLSPPSAMGSNYTLVLPSLPPQQNIMTLDAAGNMSAQWNVDNTTVQVVSNLIGVKPASIGFTQLSAPGQGTSSSTGTVNITSTSFVEITAVNITTTGGPVLLVIGSDAQGNQCSAGNVNVFINVIRDNAFLIANYSFAANSPLFAFSALDMNISLPAGTHRYSLQVALRPGASNAQLANIAIYAREIR